MAEYRIYFLDRGGHIQRSFEMECASDEEAIRTVAEHDVGQPMELWSGDRVVKKFEARRDA